MANARKISVLVSGMILISACAAPHPDSKPSAGLPHHENQDASTQRDSTASAQNGETNLAQKELASGIASFENNDLVPARKALLHALQLGLLRSQDQVAAHKYLAFIDCATHRKKQCRKEFKDALEIDPSFTLSPAEAGHPVWGPIFSAEKARYSRTVFAHSKSTPQD